MPGVIAPLTASVAEVVVVPVKLDVSLLDEVLICTVYPSHAVQFEPSFLNVIVTLLLLDTALVAVSVVAAPTFIVVDAVLVDAIALDVVLLVQLENA